MDRRYLYQVVFRYKKSLLDNFSNPIKAYWTGATLAARVTSPYYLIIETHGGTFEDTAVIQEALRIEALALK